MIPIPLKDQKPPKSSSEEKIWLFDSLYDSWVLVFSRSIDFNETDLGDLTHWLPEDGIPLPLDY